jgi:hypothetical protein
VKTSGDLDVLRRDALHRAVQRVADLLEMADDDDRIMFPGTYIRADIARDEIHHLYQRICTEITRPEPRPIRGRGPVTVTIFCPHCGRAYPLFSSCGCWASRL